MGEIAAGIESDPDKLNGAPVLKNTRIPVSFIVENLQRMSVEEVAEDLSITPDQVKDALNYHQSVGKDGFAVTS